MEIEGQLLRLEGDTENANSVKEIVLQRLLFDKVISNEQAIEYSEKWQVIVIKRGWFMRWVNAFSIKNKDDYQFKFVKFED